MLSKRSRVHPKFETKYRVVNWSEYDTRAFYAAGEGQGTKAVVPPDKTATVGNGPVICLALLSAAHRREAQTSLSHQ